MRYFPIFFDLQNRPVTVIGGGEDAVRKIRLLLKTEAAILACVRYNARLAVGTAAMKPST